MTYFLHVIDGNVLFYKICRLPNRTLPENDSVQFFNCAILANFSIVGLTRHSVDYPPTLHCAQNAIDFVKCCTNEISCAHRLENIRGNIGVYPPPRMGEKQPQTSWTWLMVSCFEP